MLAIMFAIVMGVPQSTSVDLFRGANLGGGTRYWAVEDTTLDSQEPDQNFGGVPTLGSGPGKTLLIKFGDLNRALGPAVRVKDARLVLTVLTGRTSALRGAYVLKAPFGEGPAKTLTLFDPVGGPKATAARGSSTWKHRRAGAGGAQWQQAGASGLGDATPVQGVSAQPGAGDTLVVGGLGPTVQRMLDRWYDNDGLSLAFDGVAEFGSSQSQAARPVLQVELEPAPLPTGPDLSVAFIERTPRTPALWGGCRVEHQRSGWQAGVVADQGGSAGAQALARRRGDGDLHRAHQEWG